MSYIRGLLGIVEVMANHPSVTDNDVRGFDQIKKLLSGRQELHGSYIRHDLQILERQMPLIKSEPKATMFTAFVNSLKQL